MATPAFRPLAPQLEGFASRRIPASLAAGVVVAVASAALAPPVPAGGDSPEFMLVLATGGVPHPTGYPLYSLFGHAWTRALGLLGANAAWAANAWSAVGAGVAGMALHGIGRRAMPASTPGLAADGLALLPVAFLLACPVWGATASVAEVHSWHVALLATAAAGALPLLGPAAPEPRDARRLASSFGLASGAALAHHATALLMIAPLAVAVVAVRARDMPRPRAVLAWALSAALVPFTGLAFLAWRAWHPAVYQWPLLEPSFGSVVEHALGRVFGGYLSPSAALDAWRRLAHPGLGPFLGVAVAAVAWAAWRAPHAGLRRAAAALLAGSVLQAAFLSVYAVPDAEAYALPILFAGAAGLAALAGAHAAILSRWRVPGAVATASALLLAAMAAPLLARNDALRVHDREIRAVWSAIPFERGFVFWTSDDYVRLRALQILEHSRPGLVVENPAMLTWRAPHDRFRRLHGFDPLAGLELRTDADLPLVAPNVARLTGGPVADFGVLLASRPARLD